MIGVVVVVVLPSYLLVTHPPLSHRIPDHSDPKDRIIAIVRYYMSSFHAARKGTIAKKPYNPILGEKFECYWDLPNATRVPPNANAKVRGGGGGGGGDRSRKQ